MVLWQTPKLSQLGFCLNGDHIIDLQSDWFIYKLELITAQSTFTNLCFSSGHLADLAPETMCQARKDALR